MDEIKRNNLKMIVCTDEQYGMGKDNSLPWFNAKELALFQELTVGGVVVMGRKTYESLPDAPLMDRVNIVLSNSVEPKTDEDGTIWVNSREAVLAFAKGSSKDVWIIGGREVYLLFMDDVHSVHISVVDDSYECDTYLQEVSRWFGHPSGSPEGWTRFRYLRGSGFSHYAFQKDLDVVDIYNRPSRELVHRFLSALSINSRRLLDDPVTGAYLDGISGQVKYFPHQEMHLPQRYMSDMLRYLAVYEEEKVEGAMIYFLNLFATCVVIELYNSIPDNGDRRFQCINSHLISREILRVHKDLKDLGLDKSYKFTELVYGCVPYKFSARLLPD